MGVELTTNNLRNVCRICLGEGDYNLWEHKVSWNDGAGIESGADEANLQVAAEQDMTVHEVLQMYKDWEHTILDLDNELPLVCKACLDELQQHFLYYRRLQAANKQMKQLYEQALEHEEQSKVTIKNEGPIIIEQMVYENQCPEFLNIAAENEQTDKESTTEAAPEQVLYAEKRLIEQLSTRTTTKYAQKRKFTKNPKFILTGGVTQLLAHATKGATHYATPLLADVAQLSDTNNHCSPQKRKRTEEDVDTDVRVLIVDEKMMHDFYSADDAATGEVQELATTQYVSTNEQDENYDTVQEVIHELPPNAILTADEEYVSTAETQYRDTLPNIRHEGESQEEQEEKQQQHIEIKEQPEVTIASHNTNEHLTAVRPFSTLIAADSGRSIFVCKYCPQAFTASCFLMTHERNSHVCKYCSKAFVKTPDLFAHIKEAHKEHKCSVCGKELSSNGNLRAHMKRMHRLNITTESVTSTTKYSTNAGQAAGGGRDEVYIDESNQIMPAEYLD